MTGGDDRRVRLAAARLYLVTPGRAGGPVAFDTFVARVLAAGVDVVQLREKQAEARELLGLAAILRRRADEAGALFVVNDRVDIALAAGADGVHLGQNDLPLGEARRQAGPDILLGLSTHTAADVDASVGGPADYIATGPVFATLTKPGRPAVGFDLVRHAAATTDRPFFAIGGIGGRTLGDVLAAGATRVAVVRAITEAPDPAAAVRAFREGLDARS